MNDQPTLSKITLAVSLLAEAQRELRAEYGAEVRPINDALSAVYKAREQIKHLMGQREARMRLDRVFASERKDRP